MPFVAVDEAAATKNMCHSDDCGRIEGSQKLLHKHFSVKVQIFISQSTDFTSFRLISKSTEAHSAARGVLIVQSILVYYDSARLMQNLILLSFFFSLL